MIYVFEDDERDPLPRLFMKSYSAQTKSSFIYTRGNGNIYKTVNNLINGSETLVVYLDTIPGNDSTRRIYNHLARLSRLNNRKMIILPILGLEYYFIKSIQNESVIIFREDVDICVKRKPYFTSKIISGMREQRYCTSYERYCKLILVKAVLDCVRNSENNGSNRYFRWYYEKDCKCPEALDKCKDKTLVNKSADLLREYPCVPENSLNVDEESLVLRRFWEVHRELVEEHNLLCKELRQAEPDETKKNLYKEIKAI